MPTKIPLFSSLKNHGNHSLCISSSSSHNIIPSHGLISSLPELLRNRPNQVPFWNWTRLWRPSVPKVCYLHRKQAHFHLPHGLLPGHKHRLHLPSHLYLRPFNVDLLLHSAQQRVRTDWDAPFSFHKNTVFTLLDCGPNNGTHCDITGSPICSFLYSCRAISTVNLPVSTCCVYTPVDLGPSFTMDLDKLKCSSYAGFYSFNEQESNPDEWKYGIALKYKFNVFDDYPGACANCERSHGVCGYSSGDFDSFVCNCPSGFNTTSDCIFFSHAASSHLPCTIGNFLLLIILLLVVL